MAFKTVASLDTDVTTQLGGINKKSGKKNPITAEGFFLGSKKLDSKKSKSGYAYLHILQTPAGNLGVWGKTDMDRKLLTVTPGAMVRITFEKMVPTPNGDMYKFRVEQDADNVIDVSALSEEATEASTDTTEDSTDSTEEESKDVPEDATALLAQQQRKSEVEALLKGKTKTK